MDEREFTEEDTFRRLARPSLEEMIRLHREWVSDGGLKGPKGTMANIGFMKEHSWTWLEFQISKHHKASMIVLQRLGM